MQSIFNPRFTHIILVILVIFILTASPALASAYTQSSPYQLIWRDDFLNTTPDIRWKWVREESSLWSLTAEPGYLRITSNGGIFQTTNDQKNILLTDCPEGDFRLTARVVVTPTANFHGATLYVYQDDDNYVEVSRAYNNGNKASIRREIAAVNNTVYVDASATDLLLRITRLGNDYLGFFSEDSLNWSFIGQWNDIDLINPKIGVSVKMGPDPVALTASFDFVEVERIIYNDRWIDSFDQASLDSRWSWVRENPSNWSLTANPSFLRINGNGSLFEGGNNQENLLLMPAPSVDYQIGARVIVAPTENFQGAALYIYQDDDNYLELVRLFADGAQVRFRQEFGGVTTTKGVAVSANDILLRIEKSNSDYLGFFSENDGNTWNLIATFHPELSGIKIGLGVRNGPTLAPITADFDFFLLDQYFEKIYLPLILK